jgi:alkylhydroperoxidase family enzyme
LYDDSLVKPRNRELAVLGLASVLDVPYVVYCHRRVAAKFGVTDEQYQDGLDGKVPQGLTEEEGMAYRLGRILTTITGRLDDATWEEATSKMDKAQIAGVVQTVSGYRWVAMLEQVNGDTRRWA